MASYLSSNQPYGRVSDGLANGMIGGAVTGAALGAGAIYGGSAAIKSVSALDRGIMGGRAAAFQGLDNPTEKQTARMKKAGDRALGRAASYDMGVKTTDKWKGMSGKRKIAAIAGASVLGGALGAGIDAIN